MRATDGTSRTALWSYADYRSSIERTLAASTILVFALASFLLFRRATGGLTSQAPGPQLVATAAAVLAWAIALRELSTKPRLYMWLSLAALVMFAVSCSYPGNRLFDWCVWLTAILGFVAVARMRGGTKSAGAIRGTNRCSADIEDRDQSEIEHVLQNLTRCRTAAGHEIIRGELTAEFAPGERQATLYVAFCPPFERLPQVEANIADDSDATVKLAQVLHNGTQLAVRLSHAETCATNVAIELFAAEAEAS